MAIKNIFAKVGPGQAVAGIAAGLIAPFFVKSDDRGYFASSLITSPVVAAGTAAGSEILAALKQGATQASSIFRKDFVPTPVSPGRTAGTSFYSGFQEKVRRLKSERMSVIETLREVLADPSKHFMLSNVIYSQEYRMMSAAELAAGQQQLITDARDMRKSILLRLRQSDPTYIRQMSFKLNQLNDIKDPGAGSFKKVGKFTNPLEAEFYKNYDKTLEPMSYEGWKSLGNEDGMIMGRHSFNDVEALKHLRKEDSELYSALKTAIKQGKVRKNEIRLLSFRNGSNEAINKIVGLEVNRKGLDPFRLSFLQKDGMIYTGEFFERRGYMRDVGSLVGGVKRGDIWAIQNLGDLELLRKNIGSVQFSSFPQGDSTFNLMKESTGNVFRQSENVAFLRRNEVVMDPISGFGQDFTKGWEELGRLSSEGAQKARLEMMRKHKLITIGPSGSFSHVMQKGDLAKVVPSGVVDYGNQAHQVRWLKPIHLDTSTSIPGFHAPHSRTSFFRNSGVHEFMVGTNVHGLSSHLKNLASILPTDASQLRNAELRSQAVDIIKQEMTERGLTGDASVYWARLREFLETEGNLSAVRKLGYLGEGTTMVLGEAPNTIVARTAYIDPDSLRINLDETIGQTMSGQELLGTLDKNLITLQGEKNVIRGFQPMTNGKLAVYYDEIVGMEHAKTDHMTKGHMMAVNMDEGETIASFIDQYHGTLGTGDTIADAKMVALRVFNQDKARAVDAVEKQTSDLLQRLSGSGDQGIVQDLLAELQTRGYNWDGSTLEWDAEKTLFTKGEHPTVAAARSAQFQKNLSIMEQMFERVSQRINEVHAPALRAYTQRSNQAESLLDYSFRNFAAVDLTSWNTTSNTIADRVSLTYDMAESMHLRGQDDILREVFGRSVTEGDAHMTAKLMARLNSGTYDDLPGLTVSEAFPNMGAPNSAEFRAGSVFDPAHDVARKNWALALDAEGKEVLPVLGHEAYGGKLNQYGEGLFSTNRREGALLDAVKTYGTDRYAEAKETYLNEVRKFGFGKDNWMRAPRFDPLGFSGRLQSAPSEDLFAVGMNPDDVADIRDAGIRKAILDGEGWAVGHRHPVSSSVPYRVYADPNLDRGVLGINDRTRGLLMADYDGDNLMLSFLKPHSPAAGRAKAMAEEASSLMAHELRIHAAIEGVGDYTTESSGAYKSLLTRTSKELAQDISNTVIGRTAGGAVGRMSNVLTHASIALETNTRVVDSAKRLELQWIMWEALRQAPIRAQKRPTSGYGLANTLGLADAIERGMQDSSEAGFNKFYGALESSAAAFGKEVETEHLANLGVDLSKVSVVDGKANGLLALVRHNEATLRDFHAGINPDVRKFAKAMTATEDSLSKLFGSKKPPSVLTEADQLLPYLLSTRAEAGRGASTGATMAADMLAAANEAAKTAERTTKNIVHGEAGKILGLGLGVAAVAGILGTSLRDPMSATTANKYRPEDRIGTTDHIPGEPVAGTMAPTNPPRRVIPAAEAPRTTIVAPVHHAVDLEVRSNQADRDRAIEQARMMAKMSTDGDANVTVNYRKNPKARSLRTQEKIRELRERLL